MATILHSLQLQHEVPEAPLQTQDIKQKADSTIVYSTVGRSQYAFDIYSLPAETDPVEANAEVRLTDGKSVNFNGAFGRCPSTAAYIYYIYDAHIVPCQAHTKS